MKQYKGLKARLLKSLIEWKRSLETSNQYAYSIRKLEGVDTDKLLASMTAEQLQLVLTLVSSATGKAHDESRAYWVPIFREFQQFVMARYSHKTVMKIHDAANLKREEAKAAI